VRIQENCKNNLVRLKRFINFSFVYLQSETLITMSEEIHSNNSSRVSLRTWKFWKPLLFVILGAGAGFAYYYFVGCASGSCAITSNPYASMAVGATFGYLLKA
jgi:hypothetical protein